MDRALRHGGDEATLAVRDARQGAIVFQHGDDDVAVAGRVRGGGGRLRALGHQVGALGGGAVIDRDVVAAFDKAVCHRRTHAAETDEPDFHAFSDQD